MKKLFLFLATASATMFVSCGSDDNSNPGDPVASSIVLVANTAAIEVGQSVTFTVTDDLANVVTGSSQFFANDVAISGATWTPTTAGTFTIHATHTNGDDEVLTSNDVVITVTDAPVEPAMNAIFFDEENFSVNQSAGVFWGGYDLDDDGTVDHAYWSALIFVGTAIADADPATSDQYLDVEFLTPLDSEGALVYPTTTNTVYLGVYAVYVNGTEVVIDSQEDGSLTLGDDWTDTLEETSFVSTADLNGSSYMELNYDGSFLGVFDGSGRPAAAVKVKKALSKSEIVSMRAKLLSKLK